MSILFKVEGQKFSPISDVFMASGALNYPELIFQFDDEWIGFSKVATFKTSNSETYYISITENCCTVPAEVMLENEMITIGVYGTKGNVRITTNTINIICYKSGYGKGISPSEQSVDIITQIQQEMLKMKEDYLSKEQFREQLQEFTVQAFGAKCIINYCGTWLKQLNGFRVSKDDYNPTKNDVMVIWVNNEILIPGTDYTLVQVEDYWEVTNSRFTAGMHLTVQIWNIPTTSGGTVSGQTLTISDGTVVEGVSGIAEKITDEEEE